MRFSEINRDGRRCNALKRLTQRQDQQPGRIARLQPWPEFRIAIKDNICVKGCRLPAAHASLAHTNRLTMPPPSTVCLKPALSSSAKQTAMNSRWALRTRTRRLVRSRIPWDISRVPGRFVGRFSGRGRSRYRAGRPGSDTAAQCGNPRLCAESLE